METFLRSRNAGIIIEKGRAENSQLTEAERKFLIHHAHTYLTQKFQTVDRMQMIIVSKMMVFMVPSLKDFTEGEHAGYVSKSYSLYFSSFTYFHYHYLQSVTLKFLSKKFTNAKHNARKRFSQPPEPFEVEKLDFFKNIVVSDENMALIIDQLKATVVQRCEIIKEVKLDFLEQFPIFFPHPQLVCSLYNKIAQQYFQKMLFFTDKFLDFGRLCDSVFRPSQSKRIFGKLATLR